MEGTSRTRVRDLGTVLRYEDYYHDVYDGGSCTTGTHLVTHAVRNGAVTIRSESEVTEDVVTKNFEKLSRKGLIINNPYSNVVERTQLPLFQVNGNSQLERKGCTPLRWYTALTAQFSGERVFEALTNDEAMFIPAPAPTAEIEALTDLAVTSAWARIDTSEIQALVSIMESEKTVKGIYDAGRRLYKLMRNIKRLQLKQIAKALGLRSTSGLKDWRSKRAASQIIDEFSLDALSDRYMEIRYGWRPLMYDFEGAINAFYKNFYAYRQSYRAKEEYSNSKQDTYGYDHYVQPWQWGRYTFSRYLEETISVRAGVLCDLDLSSADPWGLKRITESIWDLVPYSFVVDWFINVGDTLSALTPDVGVSPRASWVVVTREVLRSTSLASCTQMMASSTSTTRYTGSYSAIMTEPAVRYTKTTMRVPSPAVSLLPTCKLRLNAAKILDLAVMTKNLLYGGNFPLKKTRPRV